MRLSEKELDLIRQTIRRHCNDARIFLFGSMLDPAQKGGDIDLFIITQETVEPIKRGKIRYTLEEKLLRPVDLIFHKDFERPIEKEALKGIEL